MVHWSSYQHSSFLVTLLGLLLLSGQTHADEQAGFDCHVTASGATFDLTKLAGEYTLNQTRESPPTKTVDSLRFNLCADLKPLDGVADSDQCSKGVRACLTEVNQKTEEPDRVVSVIPLVEATSEHTDTAGLSDSKYVSLVFNGPTYPHPSNSTPMAQSLSVTIRCDPDSTSDPKFVSYDGSLLNLEWSAPAGCPTQHDSEPPTDDKGGDNDGSKEENVGSGIGWFFLVVLLAFVAYFGLGAYYNYSTYGARGRDLIPHRDFWQEVPYMLKDVISHLCTSVHPRRSRGGYVAV
ncbi:hypothetical protein P691DRAFT_810395 [Macrolepiota fuliginosa MF-IS2]|uniref:Autophagy-related protein 27 n=1 Tax=Macrolepiota fuliginosa MF-IS2 TaxID=1400762 RepID=A0A9P5XGT5_9AGAR|nr:hypothetical protein P691DRAFT_810395 [Macrolepiota fuliginosa MF-IS2]